MRNIYLVAYDVSDDRRRSKVHDRLKGAGDSLQYSVFRCALSPVERLELRSDLWPLLDFSTDRVLLVDLGPENGRGSAALEMWGEPPQPAALGQGPLIV
jgi:CRISPR-associated protein Cas2